MFTIEMLPAHHGDCLWIEYGPAHRPHRVLIDGGPTYAYPALKAHIQARLANLPPEERRIDLLVITHVDADHIGGVLALLEDTTLAVTLGDVWFNGWKHLPDAPGSLGPVQGERVTWRLRNQQQPWNEAFQQESVAVPPAGKLPHRTLPGGFELTVLAPTLAGLKKLMPAWEKTVREAGLEPGVEPQSTALEEEQASATPGVLTTVKLDPMELATLPFKEDTSVANGSSIALLAEFDDHCVLLGGDAYPTVLLQSVERLRRERGVDRLELDAFKVPHHGGRSNLSLDLVKQLRCHRYLVLTNGKMFKHPHPETLARIISSASDDTMLCFNYRTTFNQDWDDPVLKQRFGYKTTYPGTDVAGLVVSV